MKHTNLIKKYKKGQQLFEKGKYRRAKWIIEQIVYELAGSDSDSMGDIHLHNSAEEYLEEITKKKIPSLKLPITIVFIIVFSIILYFIFK